MKLIHWLRIAGLASIIGLVAFFLGNGLGWSLAIAAIAIVAIPLWAITVWHKRHRGD
ncbi:hypothetical protein KBI23_24670 [bacterium]|nr:hypothetical protein [bacterium]MBP9811306.1 hypothetical protein [bacterium]